MSKKRRQVISRVLSGRTPTEWTYARIIIHLEGPVGAPLLAVYPQALDEKSACCLTLLLTRFTSPSPLPEEAVGSYPAISPLHDLTSTPLREQALSTRAISERPCGIFSAALSVT